MFGCSYHFSPGHAYSIPLPEVMAAKGWPYWLQCTQPYCWSQPLCDQRSACRPFHSLTAVCISTPCELRDVTYCSKVTLASKSWSAGVHLLRLTSKGFIKSWAGLLKAVDMACVRSAPFLSLQRYCRMTGSGTGMVDTLGRAIHSCK